MKKKQKPPYIDYQTAKVFARMYDFIIHANKMRESMCQDLDRAIMALQMAKSRLAPVEDPENQFAHFNRDHFTHDIARLRADAWEAGLKEPLFEKLHDKSFRDRFTGWLLPAVQKEEIEAVYFDLKDGPKKKAEGKEAQRGQPQ